MINKLKDSTAYAVFKNFERISQIPRCSNHEEKISQFMYDFGQNLGLETKKDEFGNIIIIKEASEGYEDRDTLILQGHLDMVCEKTENSNHNFTCDPIELVLEGDNLRAKDTTLGADDGAGVSIMMAILEDNTLQHPKLECLFTTAEETGMDGAIGLSKNALTGKNLINIDTEEDWVFIVGCAGGVNVYLDLDFEKIEKNELINYEIKVAGLQGGHSGMMINEPRINAIKLIDSLLLKLKNKVNFELHKIEGGSKHNAIPSSAYAIIGINPEQKEEFENIYNETTKELKEKNFKRELDLEFRIEKLNDDINTYIETEKTNTILRILSTFPHGVHTFDKELNIVKSSNNLAIVKTTENSFCIQTSLRSSDIADMQELKNEIEKQAEANNFKLKYSEGYPMWEPNFDNPLLNKAKEVYNEFKGKEVEVQVIHAGLETGIISEKYPDLNMIAMGPTITGAHTPNEKLSISSMEFMYEYLKTLIKNL